jgi:hypothetical protein
MESIRLLLFLAILREPFSSTLQPTQFTISLEGIFLKLFFKSIIRFDINPRALDFLVSLIISQVLLLNKITYDDSGTPTYACRTNY